MKNRIASLFLVFALLMSLCNFAVARDNRITVQSGGAERFTDVPTDHWAYAYINTVVGSGLFNGRTETTFEPSNAMTRSQFVMVMARMEGMSSLEGQYTVTKFPDVTPTRRAAGPIAWASADEQGFVRGFGDGTFKPDSPITRGQFAALIHRYIIAKRYTNLHVVDPIPAQFTDADSVSSAFTEDVEYARIHGLLTGYSDGTVRASNPITRAAIAAILARFLDLVSESGYTPLLDGPIEPTPVNSGGSIDEPPVEVPVAYDDIKLNVRYGTHGQTSIASVLRNGVQVESDDVRPGDVVRINHTPDSGYVVTVRVRDSKNKSVTVKTSSDGTYSTFTVPQNIPVTVTVTYTKKSPGNHSVSPGGGGTGGGGGGQPVVTSYYYLHANAVRSEASTADGTVWLSKDQPTAENIATLTKAASLNWDDVANHAASFTFYAVLEAAANVTASYEVSVGGVTQASAVTNTNTSIPGYTVLTITVNSTGTSATAATVATVTATFTTGTPVAQSKWTVNVTNSADFAYYALSSTAPTAPTALTENGAVSLEQTVTDGTAASVYLVITPKAGYKFADEVLDFNPVDGSIATLVSPTPGNQTETDVVRVYRITKATFPTATTTTNVSILMQLANGVGRTYDVTVQSLLWNGAAEVAMPANVPLEATVDMNPATYLNKVTVNVPFLTGYRGYHLRGAVTVTGADGSVIAVKTESTSEMGNTYSFIMPDKAVTVKVVYEANANSNLSFDVNVELTGQGTVSLNIAGLNQTTDKNTTYHVRMSDGAVIVTEGTDGTPMTQADYVELYGNANFTQSVYLNDTPVAGKDYKFVSASYNDTAVSLDNISAPQTVQNGTPLTVKANFEEITSYGYTLTVIGKGTVTNTNFNGGFSYTNTSGLPETYSSGLIVTNTSSLSLTAAPTVTAPKTANDYEVTISANGQSSTGSSANISLTKGALTNIIVEMQEKERNAVLFSVEVTGGSVQVKPESGRIMLADGYSAATAKEELKNASSTATQASDTLTSTTTAVKRSYYAYENSVITLTPNTTSSAKVVEIKVTKTPGGAASDVLDTKGFSFQLTAPQTDAVVTFGAFDSYSVLVQAPYNGGTGPSLRSLSTNIGKTYLDATVQQVLYSLNDGQRSASSTNTTTGITNVFSAPATINQTLAYYLSHQVVNDEDENGNEIKITGAASVKKMLEESIESSIATVFPSVVEAKKAEMKADPSKVTTPIGTEMRNRQTNATELEVTGAAKSAVLEATPYGDQIKAGVFQERNFKVLANVTTILSKAKEDELKTLYAQNQALVTDLTGKSAETQLSGFVADYLGKIQVQSGYDYSNLKPVFTVTPNAQSSTTPTLNISAVVTTTGAWPQLDSSVTMTSYADRFQLWVLVDITKIIYDANGDGVFSETTGTDTVYTPNVAPALYSTSQLGVTVDKAAMLRNIDNAVATSWNSAFGANGVSIDMTQVLSGELIGNVVKEAIEGPSDTLTSRIGSLGEGKSTRAAFMNLYDDFVVCNNKDPEHMITLKTDGAEPVVIGKATNNNLTLELTIDFEKILRDAYYTSGTGSADQMSYEKLVDLLVGLRNGVSTDIRETSEANNANQSAQSVIASLIERQLNGRNRDSLTVKKWGTTKRGSRMTSAERKEVANLIAGLVMNSNMSDKFDDAWKSFEDSGYQSVTLTLTLNANKRAGFAPILESFYGNANTKTLDIGFNITQEIQ